MNTRGFTLIELLVVIAIIGILASVVLGSLNTARAKGRDAAVKSNMETIFNQAAIYENTNNSYGTSANDCTAAVYSDATVQAAIAAIDTANNNGTKECYATDTAYAMAAARPVDNGFTPDTIYWCIDSTGSKCGVDDISGLAGGGTCACP